MSMVSCTEDYTDWGNPQSNPKEEAVSFGNGSVTPVDVINLADVKTEKVKVASIVAPTSSNAAYTPNYKINFDGQSFDIDADGNMATAELTSYIVDKWGKRPTERDIDATLDAWVSNGSTAIKMATSKKFQVKAVPEAPVIEEGYYLVGNMFATEKRTVGRRVTQRHSIIAIRMYMMTLFSPSHSRQPRLISIGRSFLRRTSNLAATSGLPA